MLKIETKQILAESLLDLLEHDSFNNITIGDIVKNCNTSRTTFYNHFNDKYQLMEWIYCQGTEEYLNMHMKDTSFEDLVKQTINYNLAKKDFLASVIKYQGQNSIQDYLYKYVYDKTIKMFKVRNIILDKKTLSVLKVYLMGTTRFTIDWIENNMNIDSDELTSIYLDSIPATLKKFL